MAHELASIEATLDEVFLTSVPEKRGRIIHHYVVVAVMPEIGNQPRSYCSLTFDKKLSLHTLCIPGGNRWGCSWCGQ